MKGFLRKLGLDYVGYYSDSDTYVIDLNDSDEYTKVFTKLDRSNLVEEVEDASISNSSISNVLYVNDDFSINIIADFESDNYRIVVHEMRGDN